MANDFTTPGSGSQLGALQLSPGPSGSPYDDEAYYQYVVLLGGGEQTAPNYVAPTQLAPEPAPEPPPIEPEPGPILVPPPGPNEPMPAPLPPPSNEPIFEPTPQVAPTPELPPDITPPPAEPSGPRGPIEPIPLPPVPVIGVVGIGGLLYPTPIGPETVPPPEGILVPPVSIPAPTITQPAPLPLPEPPVPEIALPPPPEVITVTGRQPAPPSVPSISISLPPWLQSGGWFPFVLGPIYRLAQPNAPGAAMAPVPMPGPTPTPVPVPGPLPGGDVLPQPVPQPPPVPVPPPTGDVVPFPPPLPGLEPAPLPLPGPLTSLQSGTLPFARLNPEPRARQCRCPKCEKKRPSRRKCLARAGVTWAGGPYKGKAAGSKCIRFEKLPEKLAGKAGKAVGRKALKLITGSKK